MLRTIMAKNYHNKKMQSFSFAFFKVPSIHQIHIKIFDRKL